MGNPLSRRRLILNADDFGQSASINEAVARGHRDGVLTSASLLVNGAAFDDAVHLARQNPRLGVGLHLTLVCGTATLSAKEIPGLVNRQGAFSNNAVASGLRFFARRELWPQLRSEIMAQFQKFKATSLPLDHVNGHLNMHLHPVVLKLILESAERFGLRALRLTRDPFWLNARLDRTRWFYRAAHAFIFLLLSRRARPDLSKLGIRHTQFVFGLLQNARMDEEFVLKLLPRLPAGDSELYSHPSLDEFRHEFEALISPRVRATLRKEKIELIRHQDL